MFKRFIYRACVPVLAAIVMFGTAGTEMVGSARAQSGSQGLALRISTPKSSYVQLEAIPFSFSLSNPTTAPVKWQGVFTLGPDMDLLIQPASGRERVIEGRMMNIAAMAAPIAVTRSGENIESGAVIEGVSLFEKAFPFPGTYQVRVRFSYAKVNGEESVRETIVSNALAITIENPQGTDFEAYNFIKNDLERARRERKTGTELAEMQRDFVDSYRSTAYGKQLTWKLALTYKALGQDQNAVRQLCDLVQSSSSYAKQAEQLLYSLDVKLHPIDTAPLPENVPAPTRPHPCSRIGN